MSSTTVPANDLYAFRFRGGRPSLNLVATVGWRDSEAPVERLADPQCFARWLSEAGLLQPPPAVSKNDLQAARELREAIYRIANAVIANSPAALRDTNIINRFATHPVRSPRLVPSGKQLSYGFDQATRTISSILSEIARDAILLLGGSTRLRIKRCARPDCTLLFVDGSRSGRRRWCSMLACGNRAKTVAYRRNLSRKTTTKASKQKGAKK